MTSSTTNHGLNDGTEYELKIGSSFQPSKASESYHLMRYDFKPPSVDTTRPSQVEIGTNKECTVTIPNVHDSGSTTYKGGRKPCQKECILIIDKRTGEITLERISSNMSLKKSRVNRSNEKEAANAAKRAELKTQSPAPPPPKAQKQSHQSTKTTNGSLASQPNTHPTHNVNHNPNHTTHNALNSSNTTVTTVKARTLSEQLLGVAHESSGVEKIGGGATTSTSDSYSSSSDSSDSDSGAENNTNEINDAFSTKAYEPPPPSTITQTTAKQPQTNNTNSSNSGGMFMNTLLNHDLHLSDSGDSDSD